MRAGQDGAEVHVVAEGCSVLEDEDRGKEERQSTRPHTFREDLSAFTSHLLALHIADANVIEQGSPIQSLRPRSRRVFCPTGQVRAR